jgi:hypothetical protein
MLDRARQHFARRGHHRTAADLTGPIMVVEERALPQGAVGLTHVLVIGVGQYPWLVGGAHTRDATITDGMDQLDSPPVSARRFADWWLAQYQDGERPLGSLAMVLSDSETQIYTRPDGEVFDIPLATIEAIRDAADLWSERGRNEPEAQMVFYFCGHGIAAGVRQALLTRDYGQRLARPMLGAIDYDGLQSGLSSLAARRQLIFIDACRMASEVLLRNANETGDVLVAAGSYPTTGMQQNVYFATVNGRPAYGIDGGPTLFTRGLLNAFKGAGADNLDDPDTWRLSTGGIAAALAHFAGALADPEYGLVQPPQMADFNPFSFHRFAEDPQFPVYVKPAWYQGTAPGADMHSLTISIEGQEVMRWNAPWTEEPHCSWAPDRFVSWLKPDQKYKVEIAFSDGSEPAKAERHVNTPYGLIKVQRDG